MDTKTREENSQYEGEQFNTKALMNAYNDIAGEKDVEFGQESGRKETQSEEGKSNTFVSDALMATYAQMMDAYQEGTIDADVEKAADDEHAEE